MENPTTLPIVWRLELGCGQLGLPAWAQMWLTVLLAISILVGSNRVQAQGADRIAAKVQQEIFQGLNRMRQAGCQGQPGKPAFASVQALNGAAKSVANGIPLSDALKASNYRASKASNVRLGGHASSATVLKVVGDSYCDVLMDSALSDLGVDVQGRQYALVFAAPFRPVVSNPEQLRRQALALVNDARSQGTVCGGQPFTPVGPLTSSEVLDQVALAHAKDMAEHSYFSHEGRDGKKPADRISASGYRWTSAGENIASGQGSVQEAVAGWIKSPGHCANLMNPRYREMGIAAAVNAGSEAGVYWVQTFGAP